LLYQEDKLRRHSLGIFGAKYLGAFQLKYLEQDMERSVAGKNLKEPFAFFLSLFYSLLDYSS